jgi:hypothetical protein
MCLLGKAFSVSIINYAVSMAEEEGRLGFAWYNDAGELHRENGPAIEWEDGEKVWALHGKTVTEHDVAAYRQAKEQAQRMKKSWEEEQIRQLTEGTAKPVSVRGPLRFKKP